MPSAECRPFWDDLPIALGDGARLRAVSRGAARRRVRSGMRVAEGRALCAGLAVLPWDDVAVGTAVDAVTVALLEASPQVSPVAGCPGLWWVGATGLDTVGGERTLTRALLRIAGAWHPDARAAVADSCVAACAATWSAPGAGHRPAPGVCVVPPGGDAAYLAPAPLALLPMSEEVRAALVSLGITTAGALAALAAEDVERRWGPEGVAAWRLARGEDRRRPVLVRREGERAVEVELAGPVEGAGAVLFVVRAALERLTRELVADGRAVATLRLTLTLDEARGALPAGLPAHTVTREVRLPRPVARVAPLLEHCQALLARWTLRAPVAGVAVAVAATAPARGEQGDLLDAAWRDPAAADAAFARLRSELGAGAVVRPVAREEHRPERQGEWEELDTRHSALGTRHTSGTGVSILSLRLLETPEAVEVEQAGGAPSAVWWRGARLTITRAAGPERLSGEWWAADGYARDYWRCEGAGRAGELVLFLDRAAGGWYLQGWYD